MPPSRGPTTEQLLTEIEVLRGALRFATGALRRLHRGQKTDALAVIGKLGRVSAEAKELLQAAKETTPARRRSG